MPSDTDITEQQNETFVSFRSYDFDNDTEFSTKVLPLLSKLESNGIGTDEQDLLLKAKARYFSRKLDTMVDVPSYNTWLASRSTIQSGITLTPESEINAVTNADPSTVKPTVHTFVTSPATSEGQPPITPLPLQELAKLIAQGRADEIPVLHIEEKIHDAPEKTDVTEPILKPWERI